MPSVLSPATLFARADQARAVCGICSEPGDSSLFARAPGEGGGVPDNSRFNLVEFNIITDTCRTTSDGGAIEMLGSGDPATARLPPAQLAFPKRQSLVSKHSARLPGPCIAQFGLFVPRVL